MLRLVGCLSKQRSISVTQSPLKNITASKSWFSSRAFSASTRISSGCIFSGRQVLKRNGAWEAGKREEARGGRYATTSTGQSQRAEPLTGTNAAYLEELYQRWARNEADVDAQWGSYFRSVRDQAELTLSFSSAGSSSAAAAASSVDDAAVQQLIRDHTKVIMLIRAYQVRGHHLADLDPLRLDMQATLDVPPPPETQLDYYGFSERDLDRRFYVGTGALAGFLAAAGHVPPLRTLREILANLRAAYCGTIGVEYMHIANREQCNWIREHIEQPQRRVARADQLHIHDRLAWAAQFEEFLALKFGKGEKRFGLEGCEALIPGMKALIDRAVERGVEAVVMGMPHRGRLNVLANVMRKPLETMFAEFGDFTGAEFGTGDVKYHLGMSVERPTVSGKKVHLSLVANPSHLEAVNPVVEGKTRAKQFYLRDHERSRVMSVLLHGDAAFSGQGVVYETMGFSDLHDYTTGGTIHIIVNNQIGFTADPRHCRSSPYCSDLAKSIQAPIFHVNGDDPEAVCYVMQLAAEWRQRFKKDCVIDIICYRRHGHNEGDEPMFTQPVMYRKIAAHPTTLALYSEKLRREGVLSAEHEAAVREKIHAALSAAFERSKGIKSSPGEWMQSGEWAALKNERPRDSTGVPLARLRELGAAMCRVPAGFAVHPLLLKVLQQRLRAVQAPEQAAAQIEWATAEALAFASLLADGVHVRLSGQDVERGTFSQRHAVLVDQTTNARFTPLNHLAPQQALFSVSNSSLSEFGVLGFELGYAMESPRALVCWEAQFGDFVNGAQVIIDQFITAGEQKWMRQSGLVLLLPHAYEGAGPEHSSGRLERFLQAADEDADTFRPAADWPAQCRAINLHVLNCSTPASYFHALRRQLAPNYRKPLVVMTPKSLLRLKACASSLHELADGTRFEPLLPEARPLGVPDARVRRVAFCSGHVYYELLEFLHNADAATKARAADVALLRLESLAPFPFGAVAQQLQRYAAAEVVWVQEEPKNMGAWAHVQPRFETALRQLPAAAAGQRRVRYVGRPPSASTATGFKKVHKLEQLKIEQAVWA